MPDQTLHPPAGTQFLCGECSESTAVFYRVNTVEGAEVCRSCADDLDFCMRCDRVTGLSLRRTVSGSDLCHACVAAGEFTTCGRCERLTRFPETVATGGQVCSGCAGRHYWRCAGDCGQYIDDGDFCTPCWEVHDDDDDDDDSDGSSCDCCRPVDYNSVDYGSDAIRYYSYKPSPEFFGEGPLYLGLELEINTPSDRSGCAQVANRHLGSLGYLKEDGSISRGFEIVTHPMSHRYALDSFPWQMLAELDERHCHGADVGLHVHVSRAGFSSSSHMYRWLKLLHRNSEHVSKVARRRSDDWAAWTAFDRQQIKYYAKGDRSAARYRAINVTNEATFEVRVFASSLNRQEVQAALDLVAASVEYTRELTVADINARGGWTWSSFTAWAAARPEYIALTREVGGDLACAC